MADLRIVGEEILDTLPADSPAARRSRRDLQRIHRAMGTRAMLLRTVRPLLQPGPRPLRVLELGAGDGSLMLGVARALAPLALSRPVARPVELTLLDRQDLVERATVDAYRALGWTATVAVRDVFDWARELAQARVPACGTRHWDLVVATLFLHHFDDLRLRTLLQALAGATDRFFASEPRRSWQALAASHLVGVLGANAVTRTDAVLSVRAGFRGAELSALWPAADSQWQLGEHAAGPFSHSFFAHRHGQRRAG
jgi:hypothetical protein